MKFSTYIWILLLILFVLIFFLPLIPTSLFIGISFLMALGIVLGFHLIGALSSLPFTMVKEPTYKEAFKKCVITLIRQILT